MLAIEVSKTAQQVDSYRLLASAYYGTDLFEGGKGLIPFERESAANYKLRQSFAYYLNYTGPIVNASVDPVFRDEIKREYKLTKQFAAFIDDVDGTGADLQDYIRRMAIFAKLYGVVYIIVDNASEFSISMNANVEERRLPYLKHVLPQDIVAWRFSEHGQLLSFSYKTKVYDEEKKAYDTQITTWTTTDWSVATEDGQVQRQGENALGYIPLVQWFGRTNDVMDIKPASEFLNVAQTNYYLYQLCSWHSQLLHMQGFSILAIPDMGQTDFTIGPSNTLLYDSTATHMPTFISPDAVPANMITDQMDRIINEMYRMSGIDSIVGVKEAKSGVAKQWDFERTNQKLADFAIQCENAEYNIISIYEDWTGEVLDYTCEYPRDFKINDVTEALGQAQQVQDLMIKSPTFQMEVAKRVVQTYLPNLDQEVYQTIVSELEEGQDEEVQEGAYTAQEGEGNIVYEDEDDR